MFGKKIFNISLDGGALCVEKGKTYGNYTVTKNLIKALILYDKKNHYTIYSFCQKQNDLILSENWSYRRLGKKFWMKLRVSFEELVRRKDIFLALNQAIPFFTFSKIISFCHGLSYYFYPHYYSDLYKKLRWQLNEMIKRSSLIIVSSLKVKEELITIYPQIEKKIKVLPFGIPMDIISENIKYQISNIKKKDKYFLFVGMNHPIKNIEFIKKAFAEFKKKKRYQDYNLYLITGNLSGNRLKQLYQQATALLTASYYESFNFPVLEALSCNCPVIGLKSAIIPELSPYVYIAEDFDDFVDLMRWIPENKTKIIDIKKLKTQFCWKKYVKDLTNLYFSCINR